MTRPPAANLLFLLLTTLAPLAAQQPAARKTGDLFRAELDQLVARLDALATQDRPARHPLGGDSLLANAQMLCAMAHGHRRYCIGDGPIVRPTLAFLLSKQAADGGFGDATTTGWVVEAMQAVDPDGCREAIAAARTRGGATLPWKALVEAVLAAPTLPQEQGAAAAKQAKALLAEAGRLPQPEAAALMVQLAACQVANKRLDQLAAGPEFSTTQQRGFAWLCAQQQDGVFAAEGRNSTALTAIALMALQTKPAALRSPAEGAAITTGLRWLLSQQRADGTFGETLANYTTCAAVGALHTFADPAVPPALQRAQRAILAFQNCEQNGYARGDRDYGSIGYGGMTRGDLSNLHFAMQALRETGLPANHEALQRTLVFLQRTQNRRASNDWAGQAPDPEREGVLLDTVAGDDGGATYSPGNSSAGYVVHPDGKVEGRSYGSMTYALLKCYALAGLPASDPRAAAAVAWLQRHWRLDSNPGAAPELGEKAAFQGLYYYYELMAQALDTAGIEALEVDGKRVDWRRELRSHLAQVQRADGSWLNAQNGRWLEGSPLLCTSYALLALAR
ncbi:MAG: terpene cyclase/mutase family protein [Planctomycetes bacterium]|nr:terpene cyclase/mutase family protein [Planctomycetota bacterium]